MPEDIIKNSYGEVVLLSNLAPVPRPEGLAEETPVQAANRFLSANLQALGLAGSRADFDERALTEAARGGDPIIEFQDVKDNLGSTTVVYRQTVLGLPIFDAALGVHMDSAAKGVTSVQSSMHSEVAVMNQDAISKDRYPRELGNAALTQMLGGVEPRKLSDVRINRQVIYRYDPDQRVESEEDSEGCFGEHIHGVKLPAVGADFKKGSHYVVNEVLFRAARSEHEAPVNWRALVEPKTGAVLYLRALVSCATGMVFVRDPQTQTGAAVTGASTNIVLNPFRSSVTLPGTTPSVPQTLLGEYVVLRETSAPVIPAPTVPTSAGAFNYDVRTDDFSAVNAYFHCDKLFRTMADYGFDVPAYFDGTTFPVPVDHRALGNAVNAQAPGTPMGNGLGELRFALLQAGEPVGIATCNRVVWHEFGHGLLWDHVNSPNFGFAHSAGDSLAAILNDPGSNAVDRFNTFPWVQAATDLGRRHDREVASGWGWFGAQYNTQYQGEQILCTTMFRFYRSIGGDANHIATKTRASQTSAYLIFKAIGLLTSTTQFPEVFVTNLQNADRTTTNFKGIAGGALHKVIRWAFEKQGLFQPAATPGAGNTVNKVGNPPEVDVYIDDGRHGEYQYQANHWSCQDIWVRRAPDGGLTHEHPVVGLKNYMYVRVKNRGMKEANNVSVAAYHCLPGTGLTWPDDWIAMDTAVLPASGPITPGAETIVGPFAFVPKKVGHECLLAIVSAKGDPANDTTVTGSIPEYRFVPFDNNIGQRNVHPVAPSLRDLLAFLREHMIWVRNPLRETAVIRIEVELPKFLRRLGWELKVVSQGGSKYELGGRGIGEVILSLEPGREFDLADAKRAIAEGDHVIGVRTFVNDELSGGMSYPLSFDAARFFESEGSSTSIARVESGGKRRES